MVWFGSRFGSHQLYATHLCIQAVAVLAIATVNTYVFVLVYMYKHFV